MDTIVGSEHDERGTFGPDEQRSHLQICEGQRTLTPMSGGAQVLAQHHHPGRSH